MTQPGEGSAETKKRGLNYSMAALSVQSLPAEASYVNKRLCLRLRVGPGLTVTKSFVSYTSVSRLILDHELICRTTLIFNKQILYSKRLHPHNLHYAVLDTH